MNRIEFDLEKEPPSKAVLAEERAQINAICKRWFASPYFTLMLFFHLVTMVLLFLYAYVAGLEMALLTESLTQHEAPFLPITLIALSVGLPLLAWFNHLDNLHQKANRRRDLLIPLTLDKCEDVVQWCTESKEIAAYQAAVAHQGRMLVEGEYRAMDAWRSGANQRAEFSRQLAACEALQKPVVAN